MTDDAPVTVGEPEWDSGLWRMLLLSGVLHVLIFVAILLVPSRFFIHPPPPLVSYTVDLIAPDKLGGTNVLEGGKGRVNAPPVAAAAPPAHPKPEPPKVEEPKPQAPPEPPQPHDVAHKPEPKPAPQPKPPEAPKKDEVALAEKSRPSPPPTPTKPAPSPAKPAPSPAKPAASPAPKTPPSPIAVAKAEPKKPEPTQPGPTVAVKTPAKPEAKPVPTAGKALSESQTNKEATEAKNRDDRIAAAVRRAEQRVGERGGGTGSTPGAEPGGALSVGPGEGAGGKMVGVEYLLYYNQMISRIKDAWAWASGSKGLEAAVRFQITENGEVQDVRITHPSGDRSFDASVERAVKAVNPLPPPPETYRKEFADVELTFRPEDLHM